MRSTTVSHEKAFKVFFFLSFVLKNKFQGVVSYITYIREEGEGGTILCFWHDPWAGSDCVHGPRAYHPPFECCPVL